MTVPTHKDYQDRSLRIAQALAAARPEDLAGDLVATVNAARGAVLFCQINQTHRFEQLEQRLEFLAAGFDDFEVRLADYVRGTAPAGRGGTSDDAEQFLLWLSANRTLTDEQCDYVAGQRARHAIEELARRNRMPLMHFQELLEMVDVLGEKFGEDRLLRVHLNPIRVWTRFETAALLQPNVPRPAEIVCYAADGEIRLAVLEAGGLEKVRELAAISPCTLDDWLTYNARFAGNHPPPRRVLADLCRELASLGLVAFG